MPNSSQYQTLESLATIRIGFTFREKVKEVANGNVRIVQIKDVRRQHEARNTTELTSSDLPFIDWAAGDKAYLQPNSIVVPARGEYNRASLINTVDAKEPVIASSQLLVVVPKSAAKKFAVLPAYLCWAINQPVAQHTLAQERKGTNIRLLSSKSLAQLKVPVPSPKTQEKIVALQQLWQREQTITQQLLNNRETLLKGMFQQLLKEDQ